MGYHETGSEEYKKRGWIGGIIGGLYVNGVLTAKVQIGSMTHEMREEFSKNGDKYVDQVMECGGFVKPLQS